MRTVQIATESAARLVAAAAVMLRGRNKFRKNGVAHLWRRHPIYANRMIAECGASSLIAEEVIEDKEARLCKHCERMITRP
jgi:hypothetical protein